MEFDSYKLEKIQLQRTILDEAKKLLSEGKNLSQVAKILRSSNYRVTYQQLAGWVKSGNLEDKFTKAQELTRELCIQGKSIEEITAILREKGYNYTPQWVGRWISEQQLNCVPEAPQNIAVAIPTTIEAPIPLIPKLDTSKIIKLLSKITGQSLLDGMTEVPKTWTEPLATSSFTIPTVLVGNLLNLDVLSLMGGYFQSLWREKNKINTAITALEILTRTLSVEPQFIEAVQTSLAGDKFVPIEMISNILNLPLKEINERIDKIQELAGELDKEGEVKTFPRGTRLEDIFGIVKKTMEDSAKADESIVLYQDPLYGLDYSGALKLIVNAASTYKVVSIGDVIRLLGKDLWPNEEQVKLFEEAWGNAVDEGEIKPSHQIFSMGKQIIDVSAESRGIFRGLAAVVHDIAKGSMVIHYEEINSWTVMFLILARMAKKIKDEGPLPKPELQKMIPEMRTIEKLVDDFIDIGFLVPVKRSKTIITEPVYEIDKDKVTSKLNTFKTNFYNLKIWSPPDDDSESSKTSLFEVLNPLPKPNDQCFCGSGKKFKKCHKYLFD